MCALVYVIPALAFALLISRLNFAAMLTARLGLSICIGVPMFWAVLVPGGLWYLVVPILTPAAMVCFLVNAGTSLKPPGGTEDMTQLS